MARFKVTYNAALERRLALGVQRMTKVRGLHPDPLSVWGFTVKCLNLFIAFAAN
jgi:hypothetical protein